VTSGERSAAASELRLPSYLCIESLNCLKNWSYFSWPPSAAKRNGYTFLTPAYAKATAWQADITHVSLIVHSLVKLLKEGLVLFLSTLCSKAERIYALNANFLRIRLRLKDVHNFGYEFL
jgi:hypothetical protein